MTNAADLSINGKESAGRLWRTKWPVALAGGSVGCSEARGEMERIKPPGEDKQEKDEENGVMKAQSNGRNSSWLRSTGPPPYIPCCC
jgi:hypothetical protein